MFSFPPFTHQLGLLGCTWWSFSFPTYEKSREGAAASVCGGGGQIFLGSKGGPLFFSVPKRGVRIFWGSNIFFHKWDQVGDQNFPIAIVFLSHSATCEKILDTPLWPLKNPGPPFDTLKKKTCHPPLGTPKNFVPPQTHAPLPVKNDSSLRDCPIFHTIFEILTPFGFGWVGGSWPVWPLGF